MQAPSGSALLLLLLLLLLQFHCHQLLCRRLLLLLHRLFVRHHLHRQLLLLLLHRLLLHQAVGPLGLAAVQRTPWNGTFHPGTRRLGTPDASRLTCQDTAGICCLQVLL
jgi:hypothetical protein